MAVPDSRILFPFCEFSRLCSLENFPPVPRGAVATIYVVSALDLDDRDKLGHDGVTSLIILALTGAIPLAAGSGEAGSGACGPDQPAPAPSTPDPSDPAERFLMIGSLSSSMATRILGIYRHEELLNEVELAIASSTHQR